ARASQIVAALAVSMCSYCVGNAVAYTSPALPSMTNENQTHFSVSPQEASWVGGIMPLAGLTGGICGGPLIMYLGRKRTAMMTFVPFIVGWLLIANAAAVSMVLTGRTLCGYAVGVASLAMPVYLGEVIHPLIRGVLGLLPTLIGNMGMLLCFVVGSFTTWWQLAFVSGAMCIPFFVLLMLVPESPRWYLASGKTEKAANALARLRRQDANVSDELKEMVKSMGDVTDTPSCKELFQKKYCRAVSIAVALMVFQQLSGINAVIFYTVMIFDLSGSTIDSHLSAIIVGVVNFMATLIATFIIDLAGRKMLLYISAIAMSMTLLVLTAFFYVKSNGVNMSDISWVPLVSFMIYVLGFSMGFGPIPWLMMGEILPSRIRGPAASVVVGSNWGCTFIVTKTFQDLIGEPPKLFPLSHQSNARLFLRSDYAGAHGAFGFFCFICIMAIVFIKLVVPETKNKSLEQIEEELTGVAA
ncbi:hypothetical protein KR093_003276, partial [Drosophila rubida]